MLRRVLAPAVCRFQGSDTFFDMCSLCINLYGKNSAYVIKVIVMNIKYHNSYNVVKINKCHYS